VTGATGPSIQVIGGGGLDTKGKPGETLNMGLFLDASSPTAAAVQQVVSVSGTINNLSVRADKSPGSAPDKYKFTVFVNGVATTLTCTMTAPATTCTGTGGVPITAGQTMSIEIKPEATPENEVTLRWSATLGS
jgi:hypothetical protein